MIQLHHLHFGYNRKKALFSDLSLELEPGNIYGLLGQNGAGKTTLLKIIMGLLFPDSGQCEVFGHPAPSRHPGMLQEVYIIPEEFQLPAISIREYVKIHGIFYPRFDHGQFEQHLQEFRLNGGDKLSALSYGQKKKFLLAFGLATNSRLLILDEPTNGLDIPSKSQFRRIMAASITPERAFLISTHQVRDLESLIDPVIILDKGNIIFHQKTDEITKKLAFRVVREEEAEKDLLYAEDLVNGKAAITRNKGHQESQIDLELLFNGVISQSQAINSEFNPGAVF